MGEPAAMEACWLLQTMRPGCVVQALCTGRFADAHSESILVVRGSCLELWPVEGGTALSQRTYASKILDVKPFRLGPGQAVSEVHPNCRGYRLQPLRRGGGGVAPKTAHGGLPCSMRRVLGMLMPLLLPAGTAGRRGSRGSPHRRGLHVRRVDTLCVPPQPAQASCLHEAVHCDHPTATCPVGLPKGQDRVCLPAPHVAGSNSNGGAAPNVALAENRSALS